MIGAVDRLGTWVKARFKYAQSCAPEEPNKAIRDAIAEYFGVYVATLEACI